MKGGNNHGIGPDGKEANGEHKTRRGERIRGSHAGGRKRNVGGLGGKIVSIGTKEITRGF